MQRIYNIECYTFLSSEIFQLQILPQEQLNNGEPRITFVKWDYARVLLYFAFLHFFFLASE